MIRIVTCLDFTTDDPEEAYAMLIRFMAESTDSPVENFETSDEWFDAGGELMQEAKVSTVRSSYYTNEQRWREDA